MVFVWVRHLISFVCAICVLSQPVFFSFIALLGGEYTGSEDSVSYAIYTAFLFFFSMMLYFSSVFVVSFYKQELYFFASMLMIFVVHWVWVFIDPIKNQVFPDYLLFFLTLGLPSVLISACVYKFKITDLVVKYAEIVFAIIAAGVVFASVLPSLSGSVTASLAGATYQRLSYFSAFSSGMLLVYAFVLPPYMRFEWVRSELFRPLLLMLVLGGVVGVFIGGGRGAFVLLVLYFVTILRAIQKDAVSEPGKGRIIDKVLSISAISFLVGVFFFIFWDLDFVQSGFSRATEFISVDKGIDLEGGSSGRNLVYSNALDFFSNSPFYGYGPFGFRDTANHPHNFFLELLLQFGVASVVILLFIFRMIIKVYRFRSDGFVTWVSFLALYPIVMLMFSGSYMHSSVFGFCILFVYLYKRKRMNYVPARA